MAKDYIGQMATDDLQDGILNPGWPEQRRDVGNITHIIVHHEAQEETAEYDDDSRYEAEAEYQNNTSIPGSRGLQYHFKIDNVGLINQVRPLDISTWHAGNLDINNHSVAICVDGNFESQEPTREQFEALKQLLDWLCTEHPEFPAVQSDVYGHSEVIDRRFFPGGTACPGKNLIGFVVNYRNSNGNPAMPDVPYQHPELQPQETVVVEQPSAPAPGTIVQPATAPTNETTPVESTPTPTPPTATTDTTTPHPKVIAAALAGSITSIMVAVLKHYGITLDPATSASLVTMIATVAAYLTSNN